MGSCVRKNETMTMEPKKFSLISVTPEQRQTKDFLSLLTQCNFDLQEERKGHTEFELAKLLQQSRQRILNDFAVMQASIVFRAVKAGDKYMAMYKESNGTDEKCSYMNETVYLYRKPAGRENRDIERILKSVSALEGITYFSNSRQEDRLLYKRSYRISDAENKTSLPDPVTEDLDGLSFLVLQEDLTFGENIYRFSYRKDGGCIALFFQNETPLKVMIFTAIREQEMKSVLLVEDLGDDILFYGLVRADYLSVPGMQKRIDASLSSRMDAMYQWFIAMYEK